MKSSRSLVAVCVLLLMVAGCTPGQNQDQPDDTSNGGAAASGTNGAVPPAVDTETTAKNPQDELPVALQTPRTFVFDGETSTVLFEVVQGETVRSGTFPVFDGTVTLKGTDLATAQITGTVNLGQIESDDEELAPLLQGEEVLDVEKHPSASFVSTTLEPEEGRHTITGVLNLNGVKKGVAFPVDITLDGGTVKAHAEFSIDRTQWELTYAGDEDEPFLDVVVVVLDVTAEEEAG